MAITYRFTVLQLPEFPLCHPTNPACPPSTPPCPQFSRRRVPRPERRVPPSLRRVRRPERCVLRSRRHVRHSRQRWVAGASLLVSRTHVRDTVLMTMVFRAECPFGALLVAGAAVLRGFESPGRGIRQLVRVDLERLWLFERPRALKIASSDADARRPSALRAVLRQKVCRRNAVDAWIAIAMLRTSYIHLESYVGELLWRCDELLHSVSKNVHSVLGSRP